LVRLNQRFIGCLIALLSTMSEIRIGQQCAFLGYHITYYLHRAVLFGSKLEHVFLKDYWQLAVSVTSCL
jgi:hypothetical protein